MSKVSENFKQVIKNYLDKRAAEDELFAVTYKKENKSLEECCNYIMNCAKDNGCAGYSDEEVLRELSELPKIPYNERRTNYWQEVVNHLKNKHV